MWKCLTKFLWLAFIFALSLLLSVPPKMLLDQHGSATPALVHLMQLRGPNLCKRSYEKIFSNSVYKRDISRVHLFFVCVDLIAANVRENRAGDCGLDMIGHLN